MNRPVVLGPLVAGWLVLTLPAGLNPRAAAADPPPAAKPGAEAKVPGQFLTVAEPITSESTARLRAAARQVLDRHATRGQEPVLVFEFRSGDAPPGATEFGAAYDLAKFISTRLGGARLTVAYVPEPLQGFAALPALACDEIVLGPTASIGPITPEPLAPDPDHRELVRSLALRKGRDPALLVGMLDRDSDLRVVRTDDQAPHYVPAADLPAFRAAHRVREDRSVWEGGRRGQLSEKTARDLGLTRLTGATPAELSAAYRLSGPSSGDDPTLGQDLRPVWVRIAGPFDAGKTSYLGRRIDQARRERANLVFFQIDSPGGDVAAVDAAADLIAGARDLKTVAFVDDRALGAATLVPLACDVIVLRKGAVMGDLRQGAAGRGGRRRELDDRDLKTLSRRAAALAERKGHPAAVAHAMVDPAAVLVQARDAESRATCFVLQSQVQEQPGRYVDLEVRKEAGQALTLTGDEAPSFGLGQVVGDVEELKGLFGLKGKAIRVDGPTWVDSLVAVLTEPFVSGMLVFVGLFMLVLELKLPGIGLPAIASALAFALFFWSRYLGGTADQLEIILFLLGMVSLALELFVFPGFGVFGMGGVFLVLTSIVMASHSFTWPTHEYEYREMVFTLVQVSVVLAGVGAGAGLLGRYFPSLPVLNRLVLKAEPWTGVDGEVSRPVDDTPFSLDYLLGETGRTTTLLRPTGKAKFGDRLLDVVAARGFIEPDRLIEVVGVRGTSLVVKARED